MIPMEWTVVGVLVTLIGLAAAVGGPMLKLNSTITRMNTLLESIDKRLTALEAGSQHQAEKASEAHRRIWAHMDENDGRLADHETRLKLLEGKE